MNNSVFRITKIGSVFTIYHFFTLSEKLQEYEVLIQGKFQKHSSAFSKNVFFKYYLSTKINLKINSNHSSSADYAATQELVTIKHMILIHRYC